MIAVDSGVVVATKGSMGHWVLVGLDEHTGTLRWQWPEPTQLGSGPLDTGTGEVAFTGYAGSVVDAISDASGAVLWQRPQPAVRSDDGLVAVASLFASTAGDLITEDPSGGIEAVRASDGQVQWRYTKPVNDATVADGLVLVEPPTGTAPGAYDVATSAINPSSGKVLWSYRPVDPGGSIFTGAAGALLHQQIGPAGGQLSYVDPRTGHDRWTVAAQAYAVASAGPVIADIESTGNQQGAESIVGRDPSTGAQRWRTSISVPAIADAHLVSLSGPSGQVLLIKALGEFDAYSPSTGKLIWHVDLPADTTVDGYAVAAGGIVIQVSQSQYQLQGH